MTELCRGNAPLLRRASVRNTTLGDGIGGAVHLPTAPLVALPRAGNPEVEASRTTGTRLRCAREAFGEHRVRHTWDLWPGEATEHGEPWCGLLNRGDGIVGGGEEPILSDNHPESLPCTRG